MSYLIYQFAGWLFLLVVSPVFLGFLCCSRNRRSELGQRLGFLPAGPAGGPRIWLHAASVGEVQAARALLVEISRQIPQARVIVSTVTRQGYEVARRQLAPKAHCVYAPLDLAGIVGRAVRRLRPDLYVCLETELWPAMLRRLDRAGVRLALLNGRISERSFGRYRKIRGLVADLLERFAALAVIQPRDARRFLALGTPSERLQVLGNVKYDLAPTPEQQRLAERHRQRLGLAPGQPVWIAGSTHTGEEALLIEVHQRLKHKLPDLVWLVAPRHLSRLAEVEGLFVSHRLAFDRLSRLNGQQRCHDLVLVDSMGELAALYGLADYVFCGGSLVERGGHNIFEAAMWGRPVCYGPSMKDFADARELLEAAGGGFSVADAEALYQKIAWFIDHPRDYAQAAQRALTVCAGQQGAARRQVELLRRLLDGEPAPARRLGGTPPDNISHAGRTSP